MAVLFHWSILTIDSNKYNFLKTLFFLQHEFWKKNANMNFGRDTNLTLFYVCFKFCYQDVWDENFLFSDFKISVCSTPFKQEGAVFVRTCVSGKLSIHFSRNFNVEFKKMLNRWHHIHFNALRGVRSRLCIYFSFVANIAQMQVIWYLLRW